MSTVIGLAALLLAGAAHGQDAECGWVFVNAITVKTPDLSEREIRISNKYAHCVSFPFFPLADELPSRIRECRTKMPKRASKKLVEMADRLDSIVSNNSGSEATLSVASVKE